MHQKDSKRGLSSFLNSVFETYHRPEYLGSDPLEFVHRYEDPWDQEAVAIVAALLAYGKVKQIRASVERVLQAMGGGAHPSDWIRSAGKRDWAALHPVKHRFNSGQDLQILLTLIRETWANHGSVGGAFSKFNSVEGDISTALNQLIAMWKERARDLGAGDSFYYLLTAPEDGSCCKRWMMLLRWVGRRDSLDLGLWQTGSRLLSKEQKRGAVRPSQLLMPLDTHTGQLAQLLGLTHRRSLGFRAVLEVTSALAEVDPADPVRFDFSLARLGIMDLCQKRYRVEICSKCTLLPVCQIAKNSRSR
jgi:uncharacterized protein (TIGR02757 family)